MTRQQGRQDFDNRQELYSHLEKKMQGSYEQLRDRGKVESGTSYVKSFLLECDWKPGQLEKSDEENYLINLLSIQTEEREESVQKAILDKTETTNLSLSKSGLTQNSDQSRRRIVSSDARITQTNELGFYIVNWMWKDEEITLYLDTISDPNRRFWRAYSISKAKHLDDILNRLINSKVHLDRTWLWSSLLESTQKESQPRGFRFEYDDSIFTKMSSTDLNSKPFSLEFSGGREESEDLLNLMCANENLKKRTSLSNVRMKYFKPSAIEEFTIETLYFNGKFTTNGNSFSAHETLINKVQSAYANKVYKIEKDYIIVTNSDEAKWHVTGSPIVFDLSKSLIRNIDIFCSVVFSGKMPFKLWGIPRPTSSGEGRSVLAVDLHNGAKLFFEVYSEIICMYLSMGACGNTAIRFYTNLQKTFSRLVDVQDDSGKQLF